MLTALMEDGRTIGRRRRLRELLKLIVRDRTRLVGIKRVEERITRGIGRIEA